MGGVFVLFSYIIKWYDPVYYWQIELALSRFPVFFFGCFIAPEIERGREVSGWFLLALYVASGVLIAWMAGSPEGIGGVYEFTRYAYCPVAFGLLMLSARLLSAASGASALRPVRAGLRACLKHHSRHLHAPLCGIFGPNSLNAAHCAAFIWPKSPTKRNAHLAESMFQTRSKLEKTSLSAGGFLRFSAGYRSGQWLRFSRLFTINHGLMYFMFCVWIVTEKKGYKFSGRIIDLRGCWRYNKTVSGSVSFFRNGAADE